MVTELDRAVDFFQRNHIGYFPIWGVEDSKCLCGQDCSSPGKHPFLAKNWKKVAKTRPTITDRQNVAVACGELVNDTERFLVVVDIDSLSNIETQALVARLPKSFSYSTGKADGKHIWFWSKKLCRNSVGKPYPGIDIRGNGGYVVAPPSTHINGSLYGGEEIDWSSPILPMPSWLEDKIEGVIETQQLIAEKKRKGTSKKIRVKIQPTSTFDRWSYRTQAKIPEGQRNHALCYLLGCEYNVNPLMSDYDYMLEKALDIHKNLFENPESYTIKSLEKTVFSLHRKFIQSDRKIENRGHGRKKRISHRDVHRGYVSFCKAKTKHCLHTVEELQELDDDFFSTLTICGKPERYSSWFRGIKVEKVRTKSLDNWISLEDVSQARDFFFRSLGYNTFSRYSPQLLAAKLTELGYEKCMKKDIALWNVRLSLTTSEKEARVDFSKEDEVRQDMTVKISNTVTEYKATCKSHPEEKKYPGFVSWEVQNAINQTLEFFTAEEFRDFSLGTLLYDEESAAEMFDSIKAGDVIGVVTPSPEEGGQVPRQYVVLETTIEDKPDTLLCEPRFFGKNKGEEKPKKEITIENISCSMAIGFFHILVRDGKPYGLTEADELTIRVIGPTKPSLEDTLAKEAEEEAVAPV